MEKRSWLSGPGKTFEIIVTMGSGLSYRIPLVRGPLWPDDDAPPAYGREREDGVIETANGDFSSVDQLASFFGCVAELSSMELAAEN